MKDKYRDVLQEALKGHNCRYVEIRVEQTLSSSIRYRGKDLEEAGMPCCLKTITIAVAS